MKKTKPKLYIILGWGEKFTKKNYKNLVHFARGKYAVVPIKSSFSKKKLFSENIEEAKNQMVDVSFQDVILGFSIGALVAYQLASQFKFKKAVICSMSAILDKDLSFYSKKDQGKAFSEEQIKEFNKMKYGRPISPLVIFYGALEGSEVAERSKKLYKKYGGNLISIEKGKHRLIGDYLEMVKKYL